MNKNEEVNNKQFSLAHNWERRKEHIKKEYPDISDEDLLYDVEKEEQILQRLQKRTGKTREEIYDWLHLMG